MSKLVLDLNNIKVESFEVPTRVEARIMPTLGSCTCYDCTDYCTV